MKKTVPVLALILILSLLVGCAPAKPAAQAAATTPPVYCFTSALLEGTEISVVPLINEPVSCLHDYTLNIDQVKTAESAEVIIISGAGLEDFMGDLLDPAKCINASEGIQLLEARPHHHEDGQEHHHDHDPHIWLSPVNAQVMAENIAAGLIAHYPQQEAKITENLQALTGKLQDLQTYGEETLQDLSTRELVTFHDGFAYLAQAFDLTILQSIEEEHGSEASARDLSDLIALVKEHQLPAIFTEANGSDAAASVIARETGTKVFELTTAMGDTDYFGCMTRNIDTLKEALQ